MSLLHRAPGDRRPATPWVVGVGRSGTTLLRLMLDAHPDLAIPAETHFVPAVIEAAKRGAGPDQLASLITDARTWDDFGLDAALLGRRIAALGTADAAGLRLLRPLDQLQVLQLGDHGRDRRLVQPGQAAKVALGAFGMLPQGMEDPGQIDLTDKSRVDSG